VLHYCCHCKKKQIKLPCGHIMPLSEQLRKHAYCKWHNSYSVTPKNIYILERGSGVDQNLTFWTVAPMVDRRPRMQRSHQNATVLLFTCLIRRSDASRMNSLFLAVGCLVFLLIRTCIDTSLRSPISFSERRLPPVLPSLDLLLPQLIKGMA
jgi:hypothetical protein